MFKKFGVAALAAVTIAGSTIATTNPAHAHWRGGGLGLGLGIGLASGVAFGAYGGGYRPNYGYDYPTYGYYSRPYYARPYYASYGYSDCYIRRRVVYTPYGPVVRRHRVCY